MNIAIVSYSLTGNNERFAKSLAESLGATHRILQTKKPVNYGTITADLIFQRKPAVSLLRHELASFDTILFVAPVWMGQIAFPLRRCLDWIKQDTRPYGFLSISGGAMGDNPKLETELTRRAGRKPELVLDQHIAQLLPGDTPPTSKETSDYQLTPSDCARITAAAVETIRKEFHLE